MRLLGLDPGLRQTGWGIIDAGRGSLEAVACGEVPTLSELPLAERIGEIDRALAAVLAAHRPEAAAVEEVFVNRNPRSSLRLGLARGAAFAALARGGLAVHEYPSATVKMALTGNGRADKAQVEAMVRTLLPRARPATPDAADALAVAICHAHHAETRAGLALAGAGP